MQKISGEEDGMEDPSLKGHCIATIARELTTTTTTWLSARSCQCFRSHSAATADVRWRRLLQYRTRNEEQRWSDRARNKLVNTCNANKENIIALSARDRWELRSTMSTASRTT
jgi:hypothetical protein